MLADVIALAQLFGNNQGDNAALIQYYLDAVDDLGPKNWLSTVTELQIPAGVTEVAMPPTLRNLIGAVWDDMQLSLLNLRELEALDSEWRNRVGSPVAATINEEPAKTLALYPTPFVASSPLGMVPDPTGVDYPTYSMILIHSEQRQDIPSYLELPVALLITEKEFSRQSDHQDATFAKICGDLGRVFLELLS